MRLFVLFPVRYLWRSCQHFSNHYTNHPILPLGTAALRSRMQIMATLRNKLRIEGARVAGDKFGGVVTDVIVVDFDVSSMSIGCGDKR